MKNFFKSPIVAFLTSLKLGGILLVAVGIASGIGTFIESFHGGRVAAYDQIYAARWFEIMLGLITLNLALLFIKRMPYGKRHTGAALIHLSIVVILFSSGITRFFGYEGTMSIREGRSVDYYFTAKPHVQLKQNGQTASYPVRLYKSGNPDLVRKVKLNGHTFKLGVSNYWPHFTEIYQVGEGGSPGFQFIKGTGETSDEQFLLRGDRTTLGKASTIFRRDGFNEELTQSTYGDIRVQVGGTICNFPVGLPDETTKKCGGYSFEIVEFHPSYQQGGTPRVDGPLTNPMIRVAITAPDGATSEKVLFAFHPDYAMGHNSSEKTFPKVQIEYSLSYGLEFYHEKDTGLMARASFPINCRTSGQADDQADEQEIPAGEIFPVKEQTLYTNENAEFKFQPTLVVESMVQAPANSNDASLPSAAQITIEDEHGNVGSAICIKSRRNETITVGGQKLSIAFGTMVQQLPYSLYLDEFYLETYPGSENPASYESFILLTDVEMGIEKRKEHIFMNNPLTHRGSKHFQTSYDPDRKGTVLTINHDPGKLPTYIGYSLLCLGFVFFVLQNLLWPRKKKVANNRNTKILAVALVGLSVFGAMGNAVAQQAHHKNTGFTVLSDEARQEASRLLIQDYRGRMKPLDTLAREFVMKVAKKTKFQGQQPVDMYLNWVANSNQWWDEPCLAVRYGGLKELLGVDKSVKHVTPNSLIESGYYRLSAQVEEALRTPDRDRSKTQRKLLSFDERFNLLYMTFQGTTLRMFPVPNDLNNTWQHIQAVAPMLDSAQNQEYSRAYTDLIHGLQTGNDTQILQAIREIQALQHQFGAQVIPSDLKMEAELFYNKSHLFSWMMVPLLATFFIFMALFLWSLFRKKGARFSFRNPIYSLAIFLYSFAFAGMILAYTLRWIASGRAPLSNGHESLLFISLAAALAGLVFELFFRMAAPAGLASLLAVLILGVSMLSAFDPAIGPLVPVLVSYWLNIHVTIITASYAFLGLAYMVGLLIMILMIVRGLVNSQTSSHLNDSIKTLDNINFWVLAVGLGTLSIGTLLGGVWANESWGRYWGWDPKETWSLITIIVVVIGLHFRYLKSTRGIWLTSAWTWMILNSVVMTYFGVNYFLAGLHSYASGDQAQVPGFVYIFSGIMLVLIIVSGLFNQRYRKLK